jgi:hypothetical protein
MQPHILALRDLIGRDRGSDAAHSRIRSMILATRPGLKVERDKLVRPAGADTGQALVRNGVTVLEADQLDALEELVACVAPSVGLVRIELANGRTIDYGTCFRVSADERRVITARHLLPGVLKHGHKVECRRDAVPDGLRDAKVLFAAPDGGPDILFGIETVEWAHAHWDAVLLRLDADSGRPGLPIAGESWDRGQPWQVAVVGFPIAKHPHDTQDTDAVFEGALGTKHASFGLMTSEPLVDADEPMPSDVAGIVAHDASTLHGNSGSPVVTLSPRNGQFEVVGVHSFGEFDTQVAHIGLRNGCVYLPAILKEAALANRALGLPDDPAHEPFDWPDAREFLEGIRDSDLIGGGAASDEVGVAASDLPEPIGVIQDRLDIRDLPYRPPLIVPLNRIEPSKVARKEIGAQRDVQSCTGFALAAAIELQLRDRDPKSATRVSPAMLYGLATKYDEFVDDRPGGSSVRGAIKGFFHSGVCRLEKAPYRGPDPGWVLTVDAAKDARNVTLGAYYRLGDVLSDYQLAVQEARAVIVSAHLHDGWRRGAAAVGKIPLRPRISGAAHAFAIVGYDDEGFVIRNSWGPDWGDWLQPGHAHWSYEDWAENLIDGWVIRLAPHAPKAFGLYVRATSLRDLPEGRMPRPFAGLRDPRRIALLGHSVHVERDRVRGDGRIGLGLPSIRETALYLSSEGRGKYDGLALIFHDPTLPTEAVARLNAHMVKPFKENRLYPVGLTYGSEELRSVTLRMEMEAQAIARRAEASGEELTQYLLRRADLVVRILVDLWADGIEAAAAEGGPLWQAVASLGLEVGGGTVAGLDPVVRGGDDRSLKLHVLSFGAGWAVAAPLVADPERFGFADLENVARLAPVLGTNLPARGFRRLNLQLDGRRPADAVLPGFSGDWTDLFHALAPRGMAPRRDRGKGAGADLSSASAMAENLNDMLAHCLRTPPEDLDPALRFN